MDKAQLKKLHQDLYAFQHFAGGRVGDVSTETDFIAVKIEELIREAPDAPATPEGVAVPHLQSRSFFDNNPPGQLNLYSKQIMASVALMIPPTLDVVVLLYGKEGTKREVSCTTTLLPMPTVTLLKEFSAQQEAQLKKVDIPPAGPINL